MTGANSSSDWQVCRRRRCRPRLNRLRGCMRLRPPVRPLVAPAASLDTGVQVSAQAGAHLHHLKSLAEGARIGKACCSRWTPSVRHPESDAAGRCDTASVTVFAQLAAPRQADSVRHGALTNRPRFRSIPKRTRGPSHFFQAEYGTLPCVYGGAMAVQHQSR